MRLNHEEERVRFALYKQGLNDTTIADTLSRPRETICSWRHRRGLPAYLKKSKLDPFRKVVLQQYREGVTETEIADSLGLAQTTLSKWLRRNGFPSKHPREHYAEERELEGTERAYLAGLIDSDGHITLGQNPRDRHIGVTNTDRRMVDWVLETVGQGRVHSESPPGKRKVKYRWKGSTNTARWVLRQIIPYLVIKRERAIEFLDKVGWEDTLRSGGIE